jgi:N-acetylneuraminate synthase
MKVNLTDKKELYNFCEPYIIAELGANHNGDMALAKKLIIEAKKAGAHCVKFQSWSKDSIFSKVKYDENCFIGDDYRQRDDYTLEKIVEEFSISETELIEMKRICDEIEIDFASTPFSKKEADFLVDTLNAPFIKVASMDLNNYPFLDYLARKNKTLVISTGLSELYEIDKAVKTIEAAGNKNIIILHCVAIYPPKDEEVNLNNIESLQKLYPNYPIGFSDHTLGTAIPLASVAKGACLIEKHFTLDKDMFGWDHKVSATPDELKIICESSSRIAKALGTFRITSVESSERKSEFRRSIVTAKEIKKGEILKEEDIDYKRPGIGLSPEMRQFIIGRTASKDMPFDYIITKDDLV